MAVAAIATTLIPGPALAATLAVEHNVDIDNGDLRRILLMGEQLTGKAREEFVKGITEIKPLVDDSIREAIRQLDEALTRAVDGMQCALTVSVDEINRLLPALPTIFKDQCEREFGPVGPDPAPVQQLLVYACQTRDAMRTSMPPLRLAAAHADISSRSHKVLCRIAGSPAARLVFDEKIRADLAASAWYALDRRCQDAQSCYSLRHAEISEIVEQADPRDRKLAAASRLRGLPRPVA